MNPTCGRAKRGVRVYQETSGKRIKKDNVVAGYLNGIILALCVYSWTTTTEWFLPLVRIHFNSSAETEQCYRFGHATFHSRAYLPVIAEAYGHKILWLPKYSPDKNPIEHIWANMKNWLRNFSQNYASIRLAILDHFQCN